MTWISCLPLPGAVLADIIDSGKITIVRLTQIFRQSQASKIIINSHRINHSQLPQVDNYQALNDYYCIYAKTPEDIFSKLIQVAIERVPQRFNLHPVNEIQVLTPMNRGGLGARSLNIGLQ